MCHLLYLETTIFTKISDYATAVFSGHSMMRQLNISPNVENGRILNFEFRPIKNVIPVMCHLLYLETTIFTKISDYATSVFSGHSMMRQLKKINIIF